MHHLWTARGLGQCPSPQARQFFNRVTGLSASQKNIYDRYIRNLVVAGIWDLLDGDWVYSTASRAIALTNLVSSSYTCTENGGIESNWTAFRGYTGTTGSATVFLDTTFNPATASSPKFTQNSAHISVWNNSNIATESTPAIGMFDSPLTNNCSIYPKFSGDNNVYGRINDSPNSGGVAVTDARGQVLANRSGLATQQLYKNAVDQGIASQTSAAVVNGSIYVCNCHVVGGTNAGSAYQVMSASIGGSLTAAQALAFYNAKHDLLQRLCGITY